jgi:uncharacterized protein (TIGR03086 family)
MDDSITRYLAAAERFDALVGRVGDDQWDAATPCADWDVRALVNHLVYEQRWVTPLLAGATVAEVGDRYDGDLLGDDPVGAWRDAAADARAAVMTDDVLGRTVHLSFGDVAGEFYLDQLTCDLIVHGWDLARGIGADEGIDPELADWCYAWSAPQEAFMKGSGLFGEHVEPPTDADVQTRLLNLFGRRP